MSDNKKYFPVTALPPDTRIRNNIFPSLLFPPNASVRAGDLQLTVISTNDKKDTVTLTLSGIWVEPKTQTDTNVETIEEGDVKPGIVVPDRKIITP